MVARVDFKEEDFGEFSYHELNFDKETGYNYIDDDHRTLLNGCASSFIRFYKKMGYTPAEHHLEWYEFFMENQDTVVAAPRNHGKSVWTMLFIIWFMLFPNIWREHFQLTHGLFKVTYATSTKEIGYDYMADFHEEFENCVEILGIKNQTKPLIQNSSELRLPNKSKLKMVAVMGSVRGVRSHVLICDDLQKDKGQKVLDVIHHYESAIEPTRYPKTHAILLGTVKADNDVIMKFMKNEVYTGKLYQAINYREDGSEYALWETERPLWWLHREKRKLTPVTFSREFQNKPVTDEFAVMPLDILQSCVDYDIGMFEITDGAIYVGVDLAEGADKDADYNVITVVEVINNYKGRELPVFIIREVWSFHGTEIKAILNPKTGKMEKEPFYSPVLKKLAQINRDYKPYKIFVESNGYQSVIAAMGKDPRLIGSQELPTVKSPTTSKKHHDQDGIPLLRGMFQSRRIIFPFRGKYSASVSGSLMDELQKWIQDPIDGKYKCTAEHDDKSMSLYIVIRDALDIIETFVGMDMVVNPANIAGRIREETLNEQEKFDALVKKFGKDKIIITKHKMPKERRDRDWRSRIG